MPTPLDSFVAMLRPHTQRNYRKGIKAFLAHVYGSRDEGLDRRYIDEVKAGKRDLSQDLAGYFGNACSHLAPTSYQITTSIVKQFLLFNGVEVPPLMWRRILGRSRGNRPLTMDRPPSQEEMRRILMHARLPYKAIYLVLATSGLRVAELQQLTLRDVDLGKDPVMVQVRVGVSKSKAARLTFMNGEAKEALLEWLRIKEEYIRGSHSHRACKDAQRSSPCIFPFSYGTINHAWELALHKTGLADRDPQTNVRVRHLHTLRKYFRTKLGAVIPPDVAEALMGHEQGIQAVYRRYSAEDLAEFYRQGEPALSIMTDSREVLKLRDELEESNRSLTSMVTGMAVEMQEIKEKMEKFSRTLEFRG